MSRTLTTLSAALALSVLPLAASAQDWANSIYSTGGVELRIDERIFTLFAALNELGLDDAPVTREFPIPRREFDPVRRQVRDVMSISQELRNKFETFFDKHPLPVQSYVAYTLALGAAPTFKLESAAPAGTDALKGFETILAEFYKAARIQEVFKKLTNIQREELKRFSPAVDRPIAETRGVLKLKESDDDPLVIVVVNLLDGRGSTYGVTLGDETFLVVGPGKPDGSPIAEAPIARAFARAELQRVAAGKGRSLKSGNELLREVRSGYGMNVDNLDDYIAESLARVVAIKAAVPGEQASEAMDREMRNGYLLARELNRGLAIYAKAAKPLDAFLADFLREIDVAKLPRP